MSVLELQPLEDQMDRSNLTKSTIVSLYPDVIHETKPGVIPGVFIITPPKTPGGYSSLVVSDAYYIQLVPGKEEDEPGRRIEIPIISADLADSIINDFCNSHIGVSDDARPGMFNIKFREVSYGTIAKEYAKELEEARARQNKWFRNLVTLADDTWARFKQHRLIVDSQRNAARALGIEREWVTIVPEQDQLCPACKVKVHPEAVICHNCKAIINQAQAKDLQFAKV